MTVKNYTDANINPSPVATKRGNRMRSTFRRFCQRSALALATLVLAATAAPLLSTAASAVPAAPLPISPDSTAPVVSYGEGLATVVVDDSDQVVLFTQPTGATTWTKKVVGPDTGGAEYFDPEISSNGAGGLVIVATSVTGDLVSFIGSVGAKFHKATVSTASTYTFTSIAYSPTAGNFVVTAIDSGGNVDFWYQSGKTWAAELVQSGQFVHFEDSVVTVTDTGIVVVATDNYQELDVFYQPLFASGWTLTSTSPGDYVNPSTTWSGNNVLVATDKGGVEAGDQSLQVIKYSDKGIYSSITALGESTTDDLLTGTAIAWSGFNAVVVSEDADAHGALNFFYSDPSFAFHEESVAIGTAHRDYGFFPGVAVANDSTEITDVSDTDLYGFSQAVGASGWLRQVIAK